ncbi:MAG TPA: TolC family protein [Candidatus Acidoferrum sp.]|nr:TolC family protein [Candidatus Acidoferrum sp.]
MGNDQFRTRQAARSLVAAFLAGVMAAGSVSPAFAQNPPQNPPPKTDQAQAPAPASTGSTIAPVASLGVASQKYSRGPSAFPNIFKPYESRFVPPPVLVNSPRIDQLIHDNKLEISLQDAVELALENNLDIAVQRYYPWISDAGLLNAAAGNTGFATPGVAIGSSSASINPFAFFIQNFDPLITSTSSISDATSPINNPFISGAGASGAASVVTHQAQFTNEYSQTFHTGTNVTVFWNNTRTSQNLPNFFNPAVSSNLQVQLAQPLLNGFGKQQWTRNIRIANNNRKIADWAFTQQAITTITTTVDDYWELVYARANVNVNERAVAVAQKLYEDNKKQLEIGSMAPLDVTRSESELATNQQNLIFAQTTELQDEQTLKNDISKDPLAPNIINVQIIPTDQPKASEVVEAPTFEEAIKEAFAKRPELQEQAYNLKNADIDVRATRNALLPSLTASAFYESAGLAGNSLIPSGAQVVSTNVPIVDANGNPISVDVNGVPTPIFESTTIPTATTPSNQGFTNAQNQIFHNRFPIYAGQLQLTLPLRNRSAQAFHVRALLEQRQLETQMQQLRNAALLDVRKTYIALTQDRAQVAAASKARQLQQETFDAEQKKYQLGASTVYQVILTQRDLITAQGNEIRALANLVEAKASYERAVGRTLEVNHVTVADAKTGDIERDTLIPGTLHGQVVGTDKLFSNADAGQK